MSIPFVTSCIGGLVPNGVTTLLFHPAFSLQLAVEDLFFQAAGELSVSCIEVVVNLRVSVGQGELRDLLLYHPPASYYVLNFLIKSELTKP